MEVCAEGIHSPVGARIIELVAATEVEHRFVAACEYYRVIVALELHLAVGALNDFGIESVDFNVAKRNRATGATDVVTAGPFNKVRLASLYPRGFLEVEI